MGARVVSLVCFLFVCFFLFFVCSRPSLLGGVLRFSASCKSVCVQVKPSSASGKYPQRKLKFPSVQSPLTYQPASFIQQTLHLLLDGALWFELVPALSRVIAVQRCASDVFRPYNVPQSWIVSGPFKELTIVD